MIVVTGAAGFIGSAFVWKLNQCGRRDILLVDDFETGDKWKNVVKASYDEIILKDDFLPSLSTDLSTASKITAVVHMGACSSTTEKDVDFLVRNNIDYSKELFRFCARKKIPYIYASSAATYGGGELGYSDARGYSDAHGHTDQQGSPHEPATDSALLKPINPYGWSKQVMDVWASKQTEKPPFWAGLKFFNVYGPNEYHKGSMMSLVAKAVPQILETSRLKLFKSHRDGIGHGEQKRDFVYIKDVVDVMWEMLEKALDTSSKSKADEAKRSGIFNLGTGVARSFADLGRATFSALGKEEAFDWVDMPENIRGQYQYFTEADLTRLRNVAGCHVKFHSLEDGVRDYVNNYLTAEDKYL